MNLMAVTRALSEQWLMDLSSSTWVFGLHWFVSFCFVSHFDKDLLPLMAFRAEYGHLQTQLCLLKIRNALILWKFIWFIIKTDLMDDEWRLNFLILTILFRCHSQTCSFSKNSKDVFECHLLVYNSEINSNFLIWNWLWHCENLVLSYFSWGRKFDGNL